MNLKTYNNQKFTLDTLPVDQIGTKLLVSYLTPKQAQFYNEYKKTGKALDTYLKVYEVGEDTKLTTARAGACTVANHRIIKELITRWKLEANSLVNYSSQKHFEDMQEIRDLALDAGRTEGKKELSTAHKVTKDLGILGGHYKDKESKGGFDFALLLQKADEINNNSQK